MTQIELMQVALDLSKEFKFTAKPNPVVGALVVRNGEIVAQGACLLYTSPSPRDS